MDDFLRSVGIAHDNADVATKFAHHDRQAALQHDMQIRAIADSHDDFEQKLLFEREEILLSLDQSRLRNFLYSQMVAMTTVLL